MSMFTLAVSCLTTSNLPWFMDLTFQVPMQFALYSIGVSEFTSITSHIHNWALFSLVLCLFIFSGVTFPLNIQYHIGHLPTWGVYLSVSVISFCLFILFMGFSRQEYWSGFPFPCLVDHISSELSTMTHLSWVVLYSMAHSFTEWDKAVVLVINLISFLWLWF